MSRTYRLPAVLAGLACASLALSAAAPAALASSSMVPGSGGGALEPAHSGPVRIVSAGGMTGWQITLIALVAALVAAAAAVFLDRALARRREPTAAI